MCAQPADCCPAGAETGAGGRMRDTHATGTGSMMGAGTAGYCTGNLRIEGYVQPHEDLSFTYPGKCYLISAAEPLLAASSHLPGGASGLHFEGN